MSKISKFTKKQVEAINSLIANLDELENKPRRLFHSLEKFAIAFEVKEAIPSIRTAQDNTYDSMSEGEKYSDLFTTFRKFKMEEWRWMIGRTDDGEEAHERVETGFDAVERFIKMHIASMCKDWR